MKKDEVIARKAICQSLGKKRNLKFVNKNDLLMKSDTGRHWEYFFTAKININFFADHFAVNPILCCKKLLVFSSYLFIFLPFTPLFSLFFFLSLSRISCSAAHLCSISTIIPCCQLSFFPVFLLFPAFSFLMQQFFSMLLFFSLISSYHPFFLPCFYPFFRTVLPPFGHQNL